MKKSGIIVPNSFENLSSAIAEAYKKVVPVQQEKRELVPTIIPDTYKAIYDKGEVRKPALIFSSISNETKSELEYNGTKISKIVNSPSSMGLAVGHLWFKKELPEHFC